MKNRFISLAPYPAPGRLVSVVAIVLATATVAMAGNPFRGLNSTRGGLFTWDADLINIEQVPQTGRGVYVAVLDTGLVPNWRDYFPAERVAAHLGKGFEQPMTFKAHAQDPCGYEVEVGQLRETTWVGSRGSSHGTHVVSTILGYFYWNKFDVLRGFPLPPVVIRGIAPDVTIIPVKVLSDYQIPALPRCTDPRPIPAMNVVFGTSQTVAAGIHYATDLALAGYRPMVINMSLGARQLDALEQAALDRAIAHGVIVVASAGNRGDEGMGYPGAYPPVVSAGSCGWTGEWLSPGGDPFYRMWWLQSPFYPYADIPEPTPVEQVYASDFSSRELPGQELDVLAPGSWVRGPFPGDPGYSHLPWWSAGIGNIKGRNPGNFYVVGGTSMAAPHVSAVAALLLQKNPGLNQAMVEVILKSTALPLPPGVRTVFDLTPSPGFYPIEWEANATGAGVVQADAALAATP